MKFGDKDWFEKLEERVDFPRKISFFYNKESNAIHSCIVETKAQLDNIRWKDLRPGYMFVPNNSALITVKEISTSQQYYDELVQLSEEWEAILS